MFNRSHAYASSAGRAPSVGRELSGRIIPLGSRSGRPTHSGIIVRLLGDISIIHVNIGVLLCLLSKRTIDCPYLHGLDWPRARTGRPEEGFGSHRIAAAAAAENGVLLLRRLTVCATLWQTRRDVIATHRFIWVMRYHWWRVHKFEHRKSTLLIGFALPLLWRMSTARLPMAWSIAGYIYAVLHIACLCGAILQLRGSSLLCRL